MDKIFDSNLKKFFLTADEKYNKTDQITARIHGKIILKIFLQSDSSDCRKKQTQKQTQKKSHNCDIKHFIY